MSLDPILPPKTIKKAPETLEISFDRVSVLSPLVSHSALIETCFVDSKPICHLQGNGYEVLENKMEEIENHLSWIMTALKLIITINRNNIHGKLKLFLWSNFNIYSINKSYFCFYMKVLKTFCDFKAFTSLTSTKVKLRLRFDIQLILTWHWPDIDLTLTWHWPDIDLTLTWRWLN